MLFSLAAEYTPEADILKAQVVVAAYTPKAGVPQMVVPQMQVVAAWVDNPAISPVPVMMAVRVQELAAGVVTPPVYRKTCKTTPLRRFCCHNNNKT